MCGIFGLFSQAGATLSASQATLILNNLYTLSEIRGKESAGLHFSLPEKNSSWTLKTATSATELVASNRYQQWLKDTLHSAFKSGQFSVTTPIVLLAHSRLVTSGSAERLQNNQPIHRDGVHLIHNGILVNVEKLWEQCRYLQREAEVDTEVMAAMIAENMAQEASPALATSQIYRQIEGSASIAWTKANNNWAVLATNTGDLYYYLNPLHGYLLFASERYILTQVIRSLPHDSSTMTDPLIQWLMPGQGLVIDVSRSLTTHLFALTNPEQAAYSGTVKPDQTVQHYDLTDYPKKEEVLSCIQQANASLLRYNPSRLGALNRCTRCILPETFPFITFDEQGICNYCHHYRPRYSAYEPQKAKQNFIQLLEPYRKSNGVPEVLIPFSGGRDSSYGLHLLKKEFGLTTISFTYDWGMVTDLARRNIARICGQLGIQNILVSADIRKKRDNIRKNVTAWLKKPDLGMVPLFMAGDKHFLKVVNQLKRQTNIKVDLWSVNPLENTDFKVGFCGIAPDFSKKRIDALSWQQKIRMLAYYSRQFLTNIDYINHSLTDTLTAFLAYYFEPRTDYLLPFDYLRWDESIVEHTLINEYNWELAADSSSTWRIGDGTAAFYNYIYITARGFSEFDTFRSNQIREGMIDRTQALQQVLVENQPRFPSLCWYFETIGISFDEAIKIINQLDQLGLHH
jgi:glutamine---fructose-6-phosphate transaminase (isomerizing)